MGFFVMKRWYAIGPVATVDDPVEGSYQCAPEGCVGWIDTRPVTGEVASGFFAFDARPEHLKETHTIIGDGTRLEEYYPSLAERSAWASAYAVPVNPASDTLLQMLVSLLTEQADSDGYERCRPLTVDHRGNYEIHLGGHSRIFRSKFRGERDRLWPNLQRLWQSELRKTHAAEAKRGVDPDVQAGKMLCELALLHKCPSAELTPKALKGLRPRKPTTQLYDDFERTDLLMGVWTDPQPEDLWLATSNMRWLIEDGKAYYNGDIANGLPNKVFGQVYYNNTLSSSNQHISNYNYGWYGNGIGVASRGNLSDYQCYFGFDQSIDGSWIVRILSAGTSHVVVGSVLPGVPKTDNFRQDLVVDGSTLQFFVNGILALAGTDTVIPSGIYTGMETRTYSTSTTMRCEWWSARDLLAASVPPFLLNMRAV